MDRFQLMTVFVAVAEEEGFAAGARRLRMSPPAVTRAVAMLENRLGVKLLDRTTRYVRATDAGLRYLEEARRILADVEAVEASAAGGNAEPRGRLTVTAPVLFGRMFVMPGIVEYLERYPHTEVSAVLLDRSVNLIEEGIDVGVRIGELADSTMRALRVGSVRIVACASPDYLKRHGMPRTPHELTEHSTIASIAGSGAIHWRFDTGDGMRPVRVRPRLTVTTNDAAIEAALCGFGITRLLSYQVSALFATRRLERVLQRFEPPPSPVHIVHRESRHASAKVRSFVDLMAARLRSDAALA
ncbi:MAG: LysR family transcriptional regulator [Burkholderiaceae bacterium]